jgi:hypothetical protein
MNPSREEVLFALALEKPANKRAAFLDAICDGNPLLHNCQDQTAVHPLRPERQETAPQSTPY